MCSIPRRMENLLPLLLSHVVVHWCVNLALLSLYDVLCIGQAVINGHTRLTISIVFIYYYTNCFRFTFDRLFHLKIYSMIISIIGQSISWPKGNVFPEIDTLRLEWVNARCVVAERRIYIRFETIFFHLIICPLTYFRIQTDWMSRMKQMPPSESNDFRTIRFCL